MVREDHGVGGNSQRKVKGDNREERRRQEVDRKYWDTILPSSSFGKGTEVNGHQTVEIYEIEVRVREKT